MAAIIEFFNANAVGIAAVFGALWALSEALSVFPGVKSNGVFQLLSNIIKFVWGMFKKPEPTSAEQKQ
jgi:hypothetical protein